jgi:hypothetical protein
MARVAGYAQAAQTLNAPVLAQAQAYQQGAAAQTAPGLDPNSAAGQQSAQAAQGRQALSQLGLDALNTNAQGTQDFFGGSRTWRRGCSRRSRRRLGGTRERAVAAWGGGRGVPDERSAERAELRDRPRDAAEHKARREHRSRTRRTRRRPEQAAKDKRRVHARSRSAGRTSASRTTQARGRTRRREDQQVRHPGDAVRALVDVAPSARHRRVQREGRERRERQGRREARGDVHAATGKVENKITDVIGKWDAHRPRRPTTRPSRSTTPRAQAEHGWVEADVQGPQASRPRRSS